MSLNLLSGRFAQIGGLIVALLFGAMWLGTQTPLPIISSISREFIRANGTPADLLNVALGGFFVFAVGTVVFAIIGDAGSLARFSRDLRKSGWK